MSMQEQQTKLDGGASVSTDGLATTVANWMPRCDCGAFATHEQTWSDRGPIYYCDKPECDAEAMQAFTGDHDYDQYGLERGECLWAETARFLVASVAIEGPEQAQLANGPARMEGSA